MKDITDADYIHAKRLCQDLKKQKIRWTSWFVSQKWYITFRWCFWKLYKDV